VGAFQQRDERGGEVAGVGRGQAGRLGDPLRLTAGEAEVDGAASGTAGLEIPDIALGSVELRAAFVRAATDIVQECAVPWHDPADTFNAPDGGWGIGGRAYTGDDLVAAITAAAAG